MTILTIRQLGGANIVSIPKSILKMMGLHTGSPLDLSIEDHRIVLTPVSQESTLEALLEGSPKEHLALSELDKEWVYEKPAGKEGDIMDYIPDQGDIIWLNFDPSDGKEIIKRRPAFVISRKAFSQHTDLAIVAPITSTIRGIKLEVILPKNLVTMGSVLVHQLKSLDFQQRKAEFIEKAPTKVAEQVCAIAQVLIR